MEAIFKRIEQQYNNELPFVLYRKPNKANVNVWFQNNNNLYFAKDFTEQGFVFAPFDNIDASVLMPLKASEQLQISGLKTVNDNDVVVTNITTSAKAKYNHINLIKKGLEAIKKDVFKKVVLSRKESVKLNDTHFITIFKRLLSKYSSAFVYCWYHPKVGLWLGATPETLIKIENSRISIMALAGTQNYEGHLDVAWQNKEIQEQAYVTNFITDSLKPWAEHIKVSETSTVKAGHLLHLRNLISAQLKSNFNLKHIISVLHPTPAVCGLPKQAAKTFILDNEAYNRAYYTGFLGEINLETQLAPRSGKRNIEHSAYAFNKVSTQLYVNLRCTQLKEKEALIYVGGGITESSNPEKEWEETVSKSLIIKRIL